MESVKLNTGKKNVLEKTWKRYGSFPSKHSRGINSISGLTKSKSWNCLDIKKMSFVREGFFPVLVGPEKNRFIIKTKYINHPLFVMLLEDAMTEYGNSCDGPIMLPCNLDMFYNVLAEMEVKDGQPIGWGCAYISCSPFNPSRRLGINGMAKGYGSYGTLRPSSLIN